MDLSEQQRAFIADHSSAAMTTLRRDGTPHVVRVGVALVDGRLWSSGTRSRVRTRHLRRDPRSTLFLFDDRWSWLSLESHVKIIDGPEAPELHVRLMRTMQKRPDDSPTLSWFGGEKTIDEFLAAMVAEGRLIFEFDVQRAYGFVD
ncbi:MAG TPA: pyridoxamine 5'-phosphate oxidase family protein [Actinomycetota bacterium]|jgi:PPOX class probable F420-dependent enzyme